MSEASRPPFVERLDRALADWLASFTAPEELTGEMAAACAAGAAWPAAIAAGSARAVRWADASAMAWGIAIGAFAGAIEAGRTSLAVSETGHVNGPPGSSAADGPALQLLASDGLVAGGHEALASLDPERLAVAFDALEGAFGDGGPWLAVSGAWPRPAWPALVPCALGPAAVAEPDGPWTGWAEAWAAAYGRPRTPGESVAPADALWRRPGAEGALVDLLQSAAARAGPTEEVARDGR